MVLTPAYPIRATPWVAPPWVALCHDGGSMKPAGPVIGVLALQGDVPEHLRALESAGARPVPVRRPEELDRLDGLVIPGGESTTLWRLSVAFDVLAPLRKLIDAG